MTYKEKRILKEGVISIFGKFNICDHTATIGGLKNDILSFIDSMQEEPVSDDLEEAADNALSNVLNTHEIVNVRSCLEMFRFGAKWQKEEMLANAIDAEVLENYDGKVLEYNDSILDEKLSNCKVFDKVKILVIKED